MILLLKEAVEGFDAASYEFARFEKKEKKKKQRRRGIFVISVSSMFFLLLFQTFGTCKVTWPTTAPLMVYNFPRNSISLRYPRLHNLCWAITNDTCAAFVRRCFLWRTCWEGTCNLAARWIPEIRNSLARSARTRAPTKRTWKGTCEMFTIPACWNFVAICATSVAIIHFAWEGIWRLSIARSTRTKRENSHGLSVTTSFSYRGIEKIGCSRFIAAVGYIVSWENKIASGYRIHTRDVVLRTYVIIIIIS